jgi:uncharacterized membrane protein (TIGR02234 family)
MNRLATASLACLAGAGLALYAATRVWSVQVTDRPGLSDLRASSTGADAQPWLIALALIALAAPGALLATRGLLRRLLGGLIMVVGAGVAVAAITGRAGLDAGAAGLPATAAPIACVVGGALIVAAGLGAARHGHQWPVMSARYERRPVPPPPAEPGGQTGPLPASGPETSQDHRAATGPAVGLPPDDQRESARADTRAFWDAIDRGDDPTAR